MPCRRSRRPRCTAAANAPESSTALQKLGEFSDTATKLVNDTQADLVHNLKNLEPTHRGPRRCRPGPRTGLAFLPPFPSARTSSTAAIRGDYINLFATST